jgi:hypothetical protein
MVGCSFNLYIKNKRSGNFYNRVKGIESSKNLRLFYLGGNHPNFK